MLVNKFETIHVRVTQTAIVLVKLVDIPLVNLNLQIIINIIKVIGESNYLSHSIVLKKSFPILIRVLRHKKKFQETIEASQEKL